ncbi:hypothetical protein Fmac_017388 [Flemingia macrophylla]|uniref:Protein kinase domain-containing protein n=1 Tax=Flemingia macrophylla TaxID=520843 RepID=A0ABD1M2E2_9FABA
MFLKRFGFSRSKHTRSSGRQYPTVIEELCHQFSLADLRKATNKFDQNRIIGSTKVYKGTMGYMAMEYFTQGIVTDKCDVFSFGVVLLEVVYGGNYVAEREFMEDHIDFNKIDPRIKGKIAPECWQVFIDIALRCLNSEADERPTMGEVKVELEHALSLQEQADITNTDEATVLISVASRVLCLHQHNDPQTTHGVRNYTSIHRIKMQRRYQNPKKMSNPNKDIGVANKEQDAHIGRSDLESTEGGGGRETLGGGRRSRGA